MQEPIFESKLSFKEIEENFKGVDLFSGIMSGLQDALVYEKKIKETETVTTSEISN